MPPQLSLLAGYALIAWLIRRDMKWRNMRSWALLIPGVWLAIAGSRPLSYWLDSGTSENALDGNPINTVTFAVLIMGALYVLSTRGLDWGLVVRKNWFVFAAYGFFTISMLWSEFPLVSLKRLFKDFGCLLMALVIMTERNPGLALRVIFLRIAFVLFTLSLVFIKYYPNIGRQFSRAGDPMFTGVTVQKNSLGEMVAVTGLILLWDFLETRKENAATGRKYPLRMHVAMLALGAWLLVTCDSQTSLLCTLAGVGLLFACERLAAMRHGKQILVTTLICLGVAAAADKSLGLSEAVIKAMGRNPTLTGRTEIWRCILDQKPEPTIGQGFYIFWDTAKGKRVIEEMVTVSSAHNGYLEIYIDGGFAGCAFLGVMLLVGGWRATNQVFRRGHFGALPLIFWLISVIYNYSESSFFRLDMMWFAFLLGVMEYPKRRRAVAHTEPAAEEPALVGPGYAAEKC